MRPCYPITTTAQEAPVCTLENTDRPADTAPPDSGVYNGAAVSVELMLVWSLSHLLIFAGSNCSLPSLASVLLEFSS